ncbi:hypothetical protein Afil01_38660 [Actinorhabdospora filicis]|uniref:DUF4253 domain-containing protein n=1 Tax=Actinorhabdospora filicis TaxID=1785913 RepID=A0A9W6SND8_9ACTN|nr:DUF4253 domain-containing protein [Actinorhabdospora filicis]GLZ79059.1 hypothetical protein Afil01_38660 [Actinorhabdospora filicis]
MDLAALGLTGIARFHTFRGVPLISAKVPPGEHDRVWRELRAAHPETGLWPLLGALPAPLGASSREAWDLLRGMAPGAGPEPEPPPGSLAEWAAVRSVGAALGPVWLDEALRVDPAERTAEIVRAQREWWDPGTASLLDPAALAAVLPGEVPEPPPNRRGSDRPGHAAEVLLVPARAGYEVPGLVPEVIGTVNWCGSASHPGLDVVDQIAVLRHLEGVYGAELYYFGRGVELAVSRPPVTREAVAMCAIEQFCFSGSLTETIGGVRDVAMEQAAGRHWHLWWD